LPSRSPKITYFIRKAARLWRNRNARFSEKIPAPLRIAVRRFDSGFLKEIARHGV
jgi:hypothetical protein